MSHQPSGGISVGREASSPACDRVSDLAPYARSRASWPGRFETRLTAVTRPMQPTAKMSARSKPVEAVGRLSRSVIAFDLSAKFPIGRAAHGFGHPRSQVRKFLEDFILRDSDNPSSVERLSRQFSKPRIASVLEERLRRHVVRDPSLDKCHPPLRNRLLRLLAPSMNATSRLLLRPRWGRNESAIGHVSPPPAARCRPRRAIGLERA